MRTNTVFFFILYWYVCHPSKSFTMMTLLREMKDFTVSIPKKYIFEVYTFAMKNLSLKLDESVFAETEKITEVLKVPRNRYINAALRFYNAHNQKTILKKSLARESLLVRANSMEVLKEMELIDNVPD